MYVRLVFVVLLPCRFVLALKVESFPEFVGWRAKRSNKQHTFDQFSLRVRAVVIIKIKIRSSCEIEYFVETHLCKLCVILRSRVLRVVCPH